MLVRTNPTQAYFFFSHLKQVLQWRSENEKNKEGLDDIEEICDYSPVGQYEGS